MGGEARRSEGAPPAAADTIGRLPAQVTRGVPARRVHHAHGHASAGPCDRRLQVGVIGDDKRRVDAPGEDIGEEVRGDERNSGAKLRDVT